MIAGRQFLRQPFLKKFTLPLPAHRVYPGNLFQNVYSFSADAFLPSAWISRPLTILLGMFRETAVMHPFLRNSYEAPGRTRYCFIRRERQDGKIMKITQMQLKMIVIGLIPVFILLSVLLPKTITTTILLGMVVITAVVISYLGMSMQKQEAGGDNDLLALPPKKS
jgi:hypothetical protein